MSFELSDLNSVSLQLTKAILLYEGSHHGFNQRSYATIHPVKADDGLSPVIHAGRPADLVSITEIMSTLLGSHRVRAGVLSDNILSIGLQHVIWWQRPTQKTYFFDCVPPRDGGVSVGQRAGIAPAPAIVFVAKNETLWAFAVKGDGRPDADTQLYHAPLMNVWADGKVCIGSMPTPDHTVASTIEAWESAFWGSHFTHPNHARPLTYKGGIQQFSIDLLDGRFKKFPQRVLRPIKGLTLGELVDLHERNGA